MLPGPGLQPGKYERGPLLIIETSPRAANEKRLISAMPARALSHASLPTGSMLTECG
jgi:hypothetical protein